MVDLDQNRLVRKEVALGTVREYTENDTFIGTGVLAPWKEVQSDDVIFSYMPPDVSGLAPARAEDAESEMAQRDDTVGTGRASLIDWAIKDRYAASDVSRYREYLAAVTNSPGSFPLTISSMTEDFQAKLARDTATRRSKLDTRIEWLATQACWNNTISYNDGKIIFDVAYGRPAGQTNQAPPGGLWNLTTSDPIGDLLAMNDSMYDTHGVRLTEGFCSEKILRSIWNSDRFAARSGVAIPTLTQGNPGGTPVDPKYLIPGWTWDAAQTVVEAATGIRLFKYDANYRTRTLGTTTTTVNRFTDEDVIFFMPPESFINEVNDLGTGFGATLTSPHPEGNWTSGFYEWERETVDPWTYDIGTGVKAFPLFPHMEFSYTMRVL